MEYIIDRIEEKTAVLESKDMKTYNVPLEILPECREGDLIIIEKKDNSNFKNDDIIKSMFID